MLKKIRIILCLGLVFIMLTAVAAQTIEGFTVVSSEAHVFNFWQEFDITFFQTLPFATFWGYVLDQQLSNLMSLASPPHWNGIFAFATVVSAGNAWIQANGAVGQESD